MATAIETRAAQVIADMQNQLTSLAGAAPRIPDFSLFNVFTPANQNQPVECAGNQHTCQPQFFVPSLNRRFEMVLTGSGDSVIAGHHLGPRALVWQNTTLTGKHPELGTVTVHLEPTQVQAGTLLPVVANQAFPAINRNTYFFVFTIDAVGELISEQPAIVEALIDTVPPTSTYVFRNGPLNFYLRSDPTKTTVAILEAAVTDVQP